MRKNKPIHKYVLRVPVTVWMALKRFAKEDGVPVSRLIDRILREELNIATVPKSETRREYRRKGVAIKGPR